MKTLDEVIKAMDHVEFCCTNCKLQYDCEETECFLEDALFYLKEYRDKMANDVEAYKRGYSCGYAKAEEDEEVRRRWDESYRASQMPWNHGCEMGG